MPFPATLDIPEEVLDIARTLDAAGHEVWCVGGAVRDALLGDAQADYDLATSAKPEQVQALFPRTVAVGIEFGTVGVLDRRRRLHEVTTFRRDVSTDGRRAVVAFGASLEEDLARRDLTINAIAYHPIRAEWRDPFDGAGDLDRRLIRAVGEPLERFREDYLRILRTVRFAARLGFAIEPPTWEAAKRAADGLTMLSAERVREEWFKSLRTAQTIPPLVRLWWEAGIAKVWAPELRAAEDVAAAPPVDIPPGELRDPVLLTALLAREPAALLTRLKASSLEIRRAAAMAAGPEGPDGTEAVTVRRWLAGVGDAADDLLALWALRHGAAAPWAAVVEGIRARNEPLTRQQLAVTGVDLQHAGIGPGPVVGRVLERLLGLVLEDPRRNTRDQLLARVKELV